jgi:hypothetical protein
VRFRKWFALILFLPAFLSAPPAKAQNPRVQQESFFRALLRIEQKLSPQQRRLLSGSVNNLLSMAHTLLDKPAVGPDDDGRKPSLTFSATRSGTIRNAATAQSAAAGFFNSANSEEKDPDEESVSNPALNFQLSHVGGFTNNTSSTAWCGHNVVSGFQSSLADILSGLVQFQQNPSLTGASQSTVGVSFSTNDGESFTDLGFLNPGPTINTSTLNIGSVLGGNPVVACSSPNKFYYLDSPFTTGISNLQTFVGQVFIGVGLNVSTDGGRHFADPAAIINKDANNLLDRAWLAIDPHNPDRLYVSYTDLDLDGIFADTAPSARCPNQIRQAIELITSADGGQTWSSPSVVREDCGPFGPALTATGPRVSVGPDGKVFVAYSVFGANGFIDLAFRRSSDRGNSFDPEVSVSLIVPAGDPVGSSEGTIQGFIFTLQIPTMAVAPKQHAGQDTIFIAWADGRDNPQVDVVSPTGIYNFSDILISKSTDSGATWSAPKAVSPTPEDFTGVGRDQFHPAIAVNNDGVLAVCYYDRRNDPQNNAADHFCSVSSDSARTFRDIRQTTKSFGLPQATDAFNFTNSIGDYDGVAPHQSAEDDDSFFSSFLTIKNAVTSIHGGRIRREE